MSNLVLRRFIDGAFREDELTLLMSVPNFCTVLDTLSTFDEAEALVEVGNRLLADSPQNSVPQPEKAQSLSFKGPTQSWQRHG